MARNQEDIHEGRVKALRREIITLETEVGDLCKKITKMEAELKLLRKE